MGKDVDMRRVGICVICCLVGVVGCGRRAEETAMEKLIEAQGGGKVEVDLGRESLNIKTKDGSLAIASGKSAKIPSGFPSDVYIYKGATVDMAMQMPQGFSVVLGTKDDVSEVAETYEKKMTGEGWTQETSVDMGEQRMLMFKKGERVANATIGSEDGITHIALIAAQK